MSYELAPEISQYYERGGETTRLMAAPHGRLEFLRTQDLLRRLLDPAPTKVLDVGGATGVHAAWLAADGHMVNLVDPVPSQVAVAAALDGVDAQVGDARDLPFDDESFDAVLLMGPLYHLLEEADRVRTIKEAVRVVRPGGLVAAAAIGRFAPWLDAVIENNVTAGHYSELLAEALQTGRLRPRAHGFDGFTTAYVHRPEQLATEFTTAGLTGTAIHAVEGPAWLVDSLGTQLDDPAATVQLMEGLRFIECEPSLLGSSAHLLAAARR